MADINLNLVNQFAKIKPQQIGDDELGILILVGFRWKRQRVYR